MGTLVLCNKLSKHTFSIHHRVFQQNTEQDLKILQTFFNSNQGGAGK